MKKTIVIFMFLLVSIVKAVGVVSFMPITDIHICDEPRGDAILGWDDLVVRIDNFIGAANYWQPDFAIQMGDFPDGLVNGGGAETNQQTLINRINKGMDYIDANLDPNIPFFSVIGNHEYHNPYWNKIVIGQTIDPCWTDVNDTWYIIDYNEIAFVVINTSYRIEYTVHTIPQNELDWIENITLYLGKPYFVFMHVPIIYTTGLTYDTVINGDIALDMFCSDPNFQGGFFGHNHHDPNWRNDRVVFDCNRPWYYINTCNIWDANYMPPLYTVIKITEEPPKYGIWIRRY